MIIGDICPRCTEKREAHYHKHEWSLECKCGFETELEFVKPVFRDSEVVFSFDDSICAHKFACPVEGIQILWVLHANETDVYVGKELITLKGLIPFDVSVKDIQKYILLA